MKPLALLFFAVAGLSAQSTGEIRGFAWSAQGQPMADAKITLHAANAEDAKGDRMVTSAADGSFRLPEVPAGDYELTADASKQQLTTETATEVVLKPGQIAHSDVTIGLSTVHYGFWKRKLRRFLGQH
jgi:hypothetical protein